MNQPLLGMKVAELRQQKGLTQEKLAELCEVSTRTIQRIESGEVDPRAYTLSCLGQTLEFDFGVENERNENLWLTALHLSSIFCMLLIPLLIWSFKKNQSLKIDKQGREVLNFQVTMTLVLLGAAFLLFAIPLSWVLLTEGMGLGLGEGVLIVSAVLAPLPLVAVGIFCTYQGVVNAVRSLSERPTRYPLTIPFVR